jgi:hypothetical protein
MISGLIETLGSQAFRESVHKLIDLVVGTQSKGLNRWDLNGCVASVSIAPLRIGVVDE